MTTKENIKPHEDETGHSLA